MKKTSTASAAAIQSSAPLPLKKKSFAKRFYQGRYLFILLVPTIVCLLLFYYLPMYGIIVAFKNYKPFVGIIESDWVGLTHFKTFFSNPLATRTIWNTILLSVYSILWGFPAPIIFALILNEVQNLKFKKFVQTVSYMPHFYSTVIVVSLFTLFLSPATEGPLYKIMLLFGMREGKDLVGDPAAFRTIYIVSEIWQGLGWGAIVYLAALTNIDPQLYEAATIDGASKFQRLLYITLPSLSTTIMTMLLLRLGNLMSVGFDRAYLFQTTTNTATSEIISTYVYKIGLQGSSVAGLSYGTAIGLFNSVINVLFLILANTISKKLTETSLW